MPLPVCSRAPAPLRHDDVTALGLRSPAHNHAHAKSNNAHIHVHAKANNAHGPHAVGPPPHRSHRSSPAPADKEARHRSCHSCPPQSAPLQTIQQPPTASDQPDGPPRMTSIAAWIPRLLERAATPFLQPQLNSFSLREDASSQDFGAEDTNSTADGKSNRPNSRLLDVKKEMRGQRKGTSKKGKETKEKYFKSERSKYFAKKQNEKPFGTPRRDWMQSVTTVKANKKHNSKVLIDEKSTKYHFSRADVQFQTPKKLTLDQVEKSKPRSKHFHPSAFRVSRMSSPDKASAAEENQLFRIVDSLESDDESQKDTKDKKEQKPTPTAFRIYKYKSPCNVNEEAKIRSTVAAKSNSSVSKPEVMHIDINTDSINFELDIQKANAKHEPPKTGVLVLPLEKQETTFKQPNDCERKSQKKIKSGSVDKTKPSKKFAKKAKMPPPKINGMDISPPQRKLPCQQPDKGSVIKSLSRPYSAPISKRQQDIAPRERMLKPSRGAGDCTKTTEREANSFVKDLLTKSKAHAPHKQALISETTSEREANSFVKDLLTKSKAPSQHKQALISETAASTITAATQRKSDVTAEQELKPKRENAEKTIDIMDNIKSNTEKDIGQLRSKSAVPFTKEKTVKVAELATWQATSSPEVDNENQEADVKSPSVRQYNEQAPAIAFVATSKEIVEKQTTKENLIMAQTQDNSSPQKKEESYKTTNRKSIPELDVMSAFPHYLKEKDVKLRCLPPTQPSPMEGQIDSRDLDCLTSHCPVPPSKTKQSFDDDTTASEIYTLNSQQVSIKEKQKIPHVSAENNKLDSKWDSDYCESICSENLLAAKTERESVFFERNVMSSESAEILKTKDHDQYFSIFT